MRIIIENSFSRIEGYNNKQFQQLRTLLSYRVSDSEAFYGNYKSPLRYLIDKKGEFMTGLFPRVMAHLAEKNTPFSVLDKRIKPTPIPGLFKLSSAFVSRDYQDKAVTRLMGYIRGGAEMVTGSGKSITQALLIAARQLRTLCIVPNLTLRDQLRETFLQAFGSLDNIDVENIDSPKLKSPGNYGQLLLDETHHAAATTYRTLNKSCWQNIYHRYFFSGTFFRSADEESLLLEGIAGTPCFKFGYPEAVKAGAITPIEAYYYTVPKQEMRGNESSYQAVYSELVVNNEPKNLLIASLLGRAHKSGVSSLCLVKEIRHGEILAELTGFPFANGRDGSKDLIRTFNSGEVKTLIATTGVCAEGVDTKLAEYLFLAAGGKAKVQFMQMVGRVLRPAGGKASGKVVLFKDTSHKYLSKHFNQCVKYLMDEYAVKPTQLTYL